MFGIDLGTTNYCVSLAHGKEIPEVVNIADKYTMPPVVTFARSSFHVGHQALIHEDMKQSYQTIHCVKRLIGRSCAEIANNNEDDLITFHYEDDGSNNATARVNFWYKERKLSPEFISALILYKIRSSLIDRYKLKKRPKDFYFCTRN